MEMERRTISLGQILAMACLVLAGSLAYQFLLGENRQGSFLKDNGAIDGAARAEQVESQMTAFLEENSDSYFAYFSPEEYNEKIEELSGSFGGIGIYVDQRPEDGAVRLLMPFADSPAERAGLQYGDIVVSVNGENMRGKDLDYVTGKMKGEVGKKVRIQVERDGVLLPEKTLTRENIVTPAVTGQRLAGENGNIGYIRIATFNLNISDEFSEVYEDVLTGDGDLEGIIIDLRYNPGGALNGALWLLDYFLPKDETLLLMRGDTGNERYVGSVEGVDIPVVILQNESSASASEVFTGTMQDYDRAETVGSNSYGKGIVQSLVGLNSGAGLRYTHAQYFTAKGREVHKKGLAPDYEVPWPADNSISNVLSMDVTKDPQLAKGVEILQQKIAGTLPEDEAA